MTRCWLAQFSEAPCEGRLIRAHLIQKQTIRRELGNGWRFVADDPRCWVWACGGVTGCSGHHGMFDYARTLRVPRERLPGGVEGFADEYGLGWYLDRTYGPQREAA